MEEKRYLDKALQRIIDNKMYQVDGLEMYTVDEARSAVKYLKIYSNKFPLEREIIRKDVESKSFADFNGWSTDDIAAYFAAYAGKDYKYSKHCDEFILYKLEAEDDEEYISRLITVIEDYILKDK